jgi:hypothetical protein
MVFWPGVSTRCKCCSKCPWFSWENPQSTTVFYDQVTILSGSHWNSAGSFVQWQGSVSGGSTGRLLLNGSATTTQYATTVTFESFPSGFDDTVFRIYENCNGTPGTCYGEVRSGGAGYIKAMGTIVKPLLYDFTPEFGATMIVCIEKEPNSGGQYMITCAFSDGTHPYALVSTALSPSNKGVILECTSTNDVRISSVVAMNHMNGSVLCESCLQDCGCPNCIMQISIDGIENASGEYLCAVDPAGEEANAEICDNANGDYFLNSAKGVFTAQQISNDDIEGSRRCVWWKCVDLTPGTGACCLLMVCSMVYDPTSGLTTMHAGLHLLSGTCAFCTNTSPCIYTPTDGWDIPQCCVCSSMFFAQTINTGGAPQNCGLLSDYSIPQVTSGDAVYGLILTGGCCDLSGATFSIITTENNCSEPADAPVVLVTGDSEAVGNHSLTATTFNGTDYGTVQVGTAVTHTFTITNTGTGDLVIGNVTISGSPDFTITANVGSNTLAPSASTTFAITYTPTLEVNNCAEDVAWLEFTNNIPASDPFWAQVQGRSTSGVIGVTGKNSMGVAHSILNAAANSPSTTNGTDFGTVAIGSGMSETYTIKNSGTNNLGLGVVNISGADAGDFTVTSQPSSTLLTPSSSTTFTVEFSPLLTGTRAATINIPTSDCETNNPFFFNVQGVGTGTVLGSPPPCPADTTTAYLTIYGMSGPDPSCPDYDGTFPIPWTTDCTYAAGGIIPPNSEDALVQITYATVSGSPVTYINVQLSLLAGATDGGLAWAVTIPGWITSFSGVNLGEPTWSGATTCDTTGVVGILTIS